MLAQELSTVQYSGRTGRSNGSQEAAGPQLKVQLTATPMVRSALVLAAVVWIFNGLAAAAVSAVAYVGLASIFQLIVLKRQEVRFNNAQAVGSVITHLRAARRLAFAAVAFFQMAALTF
ncbi:MAG: hypothetical protein RL764_542 [Pseudomonadota bacterium]